MDALRQVDGWPCEHVAVGVTGAVEATHGDVERRFAWASVTKLATAVAMLVAAEEGLVDLDEPAGPPGSTFRHLLAHASGLPFDHGAPIARPGGGASTRTTASTSRPRSSSERAEMPFAEYFAHVWQRNDARAATARPASGVDGHARRPARARPRAAGADPARARDARRGDRRCSSPGLGGVLPGFGRQDPNDWGLGLELRDAKSPHWTGARNSPQTFGHFGRSGTFLWVDPVAGIALACLTDRAFGDWAAEAWPRRLATPCSAAVALSLHPGFTFLTYARGMASRLEPVHRRVRLARACWSGAAIVVFGAAMALARVQFPGITSTA